MALAQSPSSLTGAKASEMSAASPVLNDGAAVDDKSPEISQPESGSSTKRPRVSGFGVIIDKVLNLISAVPFGIVLLIFLITACMIGMLIQQQELQSFSGYYAELTPAEKTIYGQLGFFDIYHAWYFNLLLLLLSLNIILASIDHFPAAWSYIVRKKLTASPTFVMAQKFKEKIELPKEERKLLTERAVNAARALKFKVRVTEEESRTTVMAERGVWNRLGAYVVHIGLLTIFLGGFLTSRGHTGSMSVMPGKSNNKMVKTVFNSENMATPSVAELALPFTIEGLDIQQKLINKEGSIDQGNTLDWLTEINIHDPETGQTTRALVHLNSPFDYRGYRFFQASYNQPGNARTIKLRVIPNAANSGGSPQEITIQRNGEAKLADGTRLKFSQFLGHLVVNRDGQIDLGSVGYQNPAVHLLYVKPDGKEGDAWALTQQFIEQISSAPFLQSKFPNDGPYQFILTDFEKVGRDHVLSIQFDPGARVVYVGFTILCLMLIAVFFFSHQRLWIVVEDGKVHLGGDSNRNRLGFEDRARKVIALIREPRSAS